MRYYRRVGQEERTDAATAAGEAAFERAKQSSWPPTQGDYEAIGAVAGTAAGAIIGGPAGAAVGSVVGTIAGTIAYKIISSLPEGFLDAGYNPAARYWVALDAFKVTLDSIVLDLAKQCNTTKENEYSALIRWGVEGLTSEGLPYLVWREKATKWGPPAAMQALEKLKKQVFAAASARTAECETIKQGTKKTSVGTVIAVGLASAIGIGLIQKFVTRGKF